MAMVISRKYEVLGPLGQGSMGVVYKVRHTTLDAIMALKVLPRDLMEKPEMVTRFYREARVMARLTHPNIVRVSDIDRDEALNFHYFVMEYIQGQTFAQYLRERGLLPLLEVLEITRQIAKALLYAHTHTPAVIHRDIKPANIMMEERSARIVVMDFGIAKELDDSEMTKSGVAIGTLKYCSPEQMRHDPLDGGADIYSLGMVMYEAYTGAQFFAGLDETSVIGKVLYETQEHVPQFSRPTSPVFAALITKAIAKSRERRYRRVEDFLRDLDACTAAVDHTEMVVLPAPPTHYASRGEKTQDELKELEAQIRTLEDERRKRLVLSVQTQAREARERAAREGAGKWAAALLQQGLTQEERGHAHLRAREYQPAQTAYQEAVGLFTRACEEAVTAAAFHMAEQIRQEMTAAKTEAERYGAREKARTFYGRGLALQAQADELWESKTYEQACQEYAEARGLFEDARDLAYRETFKEEAATARAQALAAREAAAAAGAEELSVEAFLQAVRTEQQAATAVGNDEFFLAHELYGTARQQYELAQQQAPTERQRQEAERQAAREEAEAARQPVIQTQVVEREREQPARRIEVEVERQQEREQEQKQEQKIERTQTARGPAAMHPLALLFFSYRVPVLSGFALLVLLAGFYLARPLRMFSAAPTDSAPQLAAPGEPETQIVVSPSPPPKPVGETGTFTQVAGIAKHTGEPAVVVHLAVSGVSRALLDGREVSVAADGFIRETLNDLPAGESLHTLRLIGGASAQSQDIPIAVTYYPAWEIRQFPDARSEAYFVAFAPDGKTVISGTRDKTLMLWDVATGQKIRTFSGHKDWVNGVAFSPDGKTLASGSEDAEVALWDAETGQQRARFAVQGTVWSVAFSPLGNALACSSDDGTVTLWRF